MPGFWRKCRIGFRCVRFAAWLLVLAVLLTLIWCNRVGLPDYLKTRVVGKLRERGVELEFSRMRLSLVHGLVAENVRVGQTQNADSPNFSVQEMQLEFNLPALLHWRWQLDGLVLHGGEFNLPLSPTNALTLTNLQTDLRILADDTWSLDHFRAGFAGMQIAIKGELAHASETRHWKFFGGHGGRGADGTSLKRFSDVLQQVHFQGEPQLNLSLTGDARDPHSVTARLSATAIGVSTPWAVAQDFQADAALTVPANAPTSTDAAWGFWTNLQPFRLAWSVRLGKIHSESIDATNINCAGVWAAPMLAVTNLTGNLGNGYLAASVALNVPTRELAFTNDSQFDPRAIQKLLPEKMRAQLAKILWTQPPSLRTSGALQLASWTNAANGWESGLANSFSLQGGLALTNATVANVKLDSLRTRFSYADQFLDLPELTVVQGRTQLRLSGQESETTQNFHGLLSGQIDEASVAALLTTSNAVNGLEKFSCNEPLVFSVDVSGNLRNLETLCATGQIALTNFAIRGQAMDSVAGSFFYTNLSAQIFTPELRRANGAQYVKANRVFADFRQMAIWITNGWALADPAAITRAIGPKVGRMVEPYHFLELPLVRVHGSTPIINIVNAPDAENVDLTFEIMRAVPFRWSKLQANSLTGIVHWYKQSLTLTNVVAELYDGHGEGAGYLDFAPTNYACDFNFSFAITNVSLHLLTTDFSTNKNHLEGQLSGAVAVTAANSDDWRSWNGHGRAQVREGRLWDVPIFAFMSPVLNAVSPGLGNSRAKDAAAKFIMTNGVISTDPLLIRSEMMRLQYVGTVDLKQRVNARVTAQFLRTMPVVGSVVSWLLTPVGKIFECRVTGQLSQPVVAPLYIPTFIPKLLGVPLHPVHTVEELFAPATDAPDQK